MISSPAVPTMPERRANLPRVEILSARHCALYSARVTARQTPDPLAHIEVHGRCHPRSASPLLLCKPNSEEMSRLFLDPRATPGRPTPAHEKTCEPVLTREHCGPPTPHPNPPAAMQAPQKFCRPC